MRRILVAMFVTGGLALAICAEPQQNVESAFLSNFTASQRVAIQQMLDRQALQQMRQVEPVLQGMWREAANETMEAIEATGRLKAEDRVNLALHEKDKSAREVFRLRLIVLKELASK